MNTLFLTLCSWLEARFEDERGATMVEYGLLVAFVALIALVAVTQFGNRVSALFNGLTW